jgi:hypothetical protein
MLFTLPWKVSKLAVIGESETDDRFRERTPVQAMV